MKKNFKIRMMVGAAVMLAATMLATPATLAWGPETRPTYTMNEPADHATFNSITDNSLLGDERQFVRVVEDGVGDTYSHDLTIEPGKRYRVYIYYHNDASETFNTTDKNQVGVALETKMMSSFPEKLAKNERQAIIGRISSTTTNPEAVWDEAYITAKEALTLHYIEGSAKIYNHWHQDGLMLSTRLFSPEGTYIGTQDMNGIVYGCDRFSGSVAYLFETKPVEGETEDPTPEEENPVTPVLPNELPKTGPMEVTLIVIVAVLAIAALGYAIHARRAARKATKSRKTKGGKKK